MTESPFANAKFPIISFGKNGVVVYENLQLMHTCFRTFVKSFEGQKVIDSTGSMWTIKSVVETQCITPFLTRLFRSAVIRVNFKVEIMAASPFNDVLPCILTSVKKNGWSLVMVGYVNEFTARESKKVSKELAHAETVADLVSILLTPIESQIQNKLSNR